MAKKPLSVQQMLGDAGAPPQVRWKGKTYTVGFNVQKAKARLEEIIRAKVLGRLDADRALLSGDAYARREAGVNDLLEQGHYATFMPGWWAAIRNVENAAFLLWSLLYASHPDVTEDDVKAMMEDEPVQVNGALRVALPDFFHAAAEGKLPPDATETLDTLAKEIIDKALTSSE